MVFLKLQWLVEILLLINSLWYLGYRTDSEGLHPTNEKLTAVQRPPSQPMLLS